jgi:hypothetical protein
MLDISLGKAFRFVSWLRVQLYQYAIPWENWLMAASRWPQAMHDGYSMLVWRFFFRHAFWIDIELMLTRPTRACLSIERKGKRSEVVNGIVTQRTKHCVTGLTVISRARPDSLGMIWERESQWGNRMPYAIFNAILKEFSKAGSLYIRRILQSKHSSCRRVLIPLYESCTRQAPCRFALDSPTINCLP